MNTQGLILFILLFGKHFLADFPLQTVYMLGKGKSGLSWIMPLAAHSAVHMIFTALILLCFKPSLVWLAFVEFVAHFLIDRIKCVAPGGKLAPDGSNAKLFFAALGFDQYAHGICYALIMWMVGA